MMRYFLKKGKKNQKAKTLKIISKNSYVIKEASVKNFCAASLESLSIFTATFSPLKIPSITSPNSPLPIVSHS